MLTMDAIERLLESHPPQHTPPGRRTPTAVALILRPAPSGPEMLFIERAHHAGDPWSGNLGFPGGKAEKRDGTARRTAERETLEEIGLDLAAARCLGRLSDIAGAHLPVMVSCFAYAIEYPGVIHPGDEVRHLFWVPLAALCEPVRHQTATVTFAGRTLETPTIRVPEHGTPLWGITYRLVMQFLGILGCAPPQIWTSHSSASSPLEK